MFHAISTRFCKSYGAALRKVPTKFHAEFHEPQGRFARFTGPRSGPDCTVGARLHRRGPIAPSGPDQDAIALSLLALLF